MEPGKYILPGRKAKSLIVNKIICNFAFKDLEMILTFPRQMKKRLFSAVLNSSENLNNYINGKLNQIFHIENLKCSQAKNDYSILKI